MSKLKKHNVETYLKACGMWKKVTEDYNPNVIISLMEGYAQLYHNNQVKQTNEASASHNKALDIDLVIECLQQVNATLERHGKIDANTDLHNKIINTL